MLYNIGSFSICASITSKHPINFIVSKESFARDIKIITHKYAIVHCRELNHVNGNNILCSCMRITRRAYGGTVSSVQGEITVID